MGLREPAVALWSLGSAWHRWDPHIHTPGTLLNDQFGGDWDAYVLRIDRARPAPVALGITDYFCLRGYKELRQRQRNGVLANILLFPNVEVRLTIETATRQGINLHLLTSPEDPENVERLEEKLAQLSFRFRGQPYPCTEQGLIRLGRKLMDRAELPEDAALREGANQFKIEFSDLRALRDEDEWVRKNVLFAIAAGNDGLSGLAKDASFRALREELGRFAQIIFSGQTGDREFWLGHHPGFESDQQEPKPCIHGCDAHELARLLEPELDRRCWIRSEPTFEGLRQTLVEPERRVSIGPDCPPGPSPSETIRAIRVRGADWFPQHDILLNEGLVTVIGARGSGKTALADLIAHAADALEVDPGPASFVRKAASLLDGVEVTLEWADRLVSNAGFPAQPTAREPRVRYLSQQFVERLCAPEGLAEPLIEELERIVFAAIPEEERFETASFSELRAGALVDVKSIQNEARARILSATQVVSKEIQLERSLPDLRKRLAEAERRRVAVEKEIGSIPLKESDIERKALEGISAELAQLQQAIAQSRRKRQLLENLANETRIFESQGATRFVAWKSTYPGLLDEPEWEQLRPRLGNEAQAVLDRRRKTLEEHIDQLSREGLKISTDLSSSTLTSRGLTALRAEYERLAKALGIDAANAKRHTELTKRLSECRSNEEKVRRELENAEKASERRLVAHEERLEAYQRLFEALDEEVRILQELYRPLSIKLEGEESLRKLSFYVHRSVDLPGWARRGEHLLDLRRRTAFQGRGSIAELTRIELLPVWLNGSSREARKALADFIASYGRDALDNLAQDITPLDFGLWMFSTDHISVHYGVRYEGVDLNRLSPGTRGVVLLTLYLALDDQDLRPLIIDQPEENLDPQSVYNDLVKFFRAAARRRQIVMVTHNANLVVNTDSDQVIVASGTRESAEGLPRISYLAGGLEDSRIRQLICGLLEGGEEAFRRRGRRYGVRSV
jgi:hypothetical protein